MLQNAPLLVLCSALLLGFYDVARKHAVKGNAVVDVLLISSIAGAIAFLVGSLATGSLAVAAAVPWNVRLFVLGKVVLVGTSWGVVFLALRRLPISLAGPIRATAPFWTLLGAMVLYGEVPTLCRAIGMLLMLAGFVAFATLGGREGFPLKSKEMGFIVLGTLLGACSALYDKFLLNRMAIPSETVQFYFATGLVLLYGAVWAVRRAIWSREERSPFSWRWTIVATGVLLIASDFLYFHAVGLPDAHISVISLFRRCSTIVSFFVGGLLFHDLHLREKSLALVLVLAGAVLVALG